jgi:NitT/TauT family transport system substrate-binding protein
MNPPDMAAALTSGVLDAYFVGEPFPSRTLKSGDAELLHYVEEIQPHFICNLMIVRNELIQKDPQAVKLLVSGAIRAGFWAKNHLDKTVEIAAQYWNQPADLVRYALTTRPGGVLFDLYLPQQTEMQGMADDMVSLGLIQTNNIAGLVDDQFAKSVDLNNISDDIHSILLK